MADDELKKQLPFPYDKDLSTVLTHLDRRTPFSRGRLANDPATAAYLAAAMRLVQRHLGPSPDREPADPDDENSVPRPLLSFLSQRAVAAEVANGPHPFPRQGSVAALRDRWKSQSDFIADLLSFAMWIGNHPEGFYEEMAVGSERLLEGPDMIEAAHELAYMNVEGALDVPSFRFGFAAMIGAEGDPTIAKAVTKSYSDYLAPWKEVYSAFMQARGLQLRPGISVEDIANLLAALVDGIALRTMGDPSSGLIDRDRRRTLLGTAALAVVHSFMEPAENPDGMTLEDAVRAMVYREASKPGGEPAPGTTDVDAQPSAPDDTGGTPA